MPELLPVAVLLVLLLGVSGRTQGPVIAMTLAWIVCIAPLASGAMRYGFSGQSGFVFPLILMGSIACFVAGAWLQESATPGARTCASSSGDWLLQRDFAITLPVARLCWWLGCAGTACICLDFYLYGGAGLNDIAALREAYIGREASLLAKLGSVLTWACLYSFGFALYHRPRLGHMGFIRYTFPVVGYFLVAVFSAGRQTSFQIMIFTLIFLWILRMRSGRGSLVPSRLGRGTVSAIAVSLLMVGYMGYVAVVRNDARISSDKVEVLAKVFNLTFSPEFAGLLAQVDDGIRTTLVEGLVYFSSSVALFERFLDAHGLGPYFGAMSFPFVFRQLEPLTGISVLGAYTAKVQAMQSLGVIGVGWTTAISSYVLDFGFPGAAAFLVAQGYYSSLAWRRGVSGARFHDAMIAAVVAMAAVYLPLLAATSDTNLLLVWLFCLIARRWSLEHDRRLRQRILDAVSASRGRA